LSEKYGIGLDTARELTKYRHRLDFFRECAENTGKNIKKFAIFMINIILPERETENGIGIDPKDAAELFDMVENEELSSTSAPLVLAEIAGKGESARAIATRMELLQISDADYIDDIVRQIVKENPEAVEKYKSGRDKALGYLVGKAMRASRGRANPKIVSRRLKEII
jgi:aspartyl-tRNA(Asn)/glutamyl-tRNA(Gln) amidotransferase subunit B